MLHDNKETVLFIVLPHIIRETDAKNPKTRSYKAFPYGVLSIATYIKKICDVDVKIIDCNLYDYDKSIELINKCLTDVNPKIVGLSMNYDNSYKHLKNISKIIKEHNNNIVTILGGSSASFSYKEIFDEQNFIDGICYTEGELPVLRLVKSNDRIKLLESDKSWITKKSISNGIVPERSFIEDLDDVIDIDYSLIQIENYKMMEAFSPFLESNNEKIQFFLDTSRGCPYKCVFCATCSGLYTNKIRYASIDKIISHVKYLCDNYGMNVLTIYDDQLLMNKERAKELFKRLEQFNLRIECPNGLSVAFIDNELACLMKKAGMDTVILAVEHGSEYMLRKVINKPLSLKMVKPVVEILRKYNFFIEAFFVMGIPGEEKKHREECLNFIKDVNFDWCGFNLATPLRGSRLYDICIKNNYIDKNLKIDEIQDKKYIINAPPHLIPEEISRETYLMNLNVNFVNNYRMKIGDYETASKCFQDVVNRTTNHAFAHYFLAKALSNMNGNYSEEISINLNMFIDIIENDKTWNYYANYFGVK